MLHCCSTCGYPWNFNHKCGDKHAYTEMLEWEQLANDYIKLSEYGRMVDPLKEIKQAIEREKLLIKAQEATATWREGVIEGLERAAKILEEEVKKFEEAEVIVKCRACSNGGEYTVGHAWIGSECKKCKHGPKHRKIAEKIEKRLWYYWHKPNKDELIAFLKGII